MRTKRLTLGLAAILGGCIWPFSSRPPVPVENDKSIVFPRFFERSAVEVGAGGAPYELDGVVLRAVMIAANDFLPPGTRKQPCWNRQEAHRYRIIRQGDIVFVRIDDDLESCGLQYVSLDTGATYAISTDGRILRRMFDGQPDDTSSSSSPSEASNTPDAGGQEFPVDSGVTHPIEDGGSAPSPASPPPAVPDGGTPGAP